MSQIYEWPIVPRNTDIDTNGYERIGTVDERAYKVFAVDVHNTGTNEAPVIVQVTDSATAPTNDNNSVLIRDGEGTQRWRKAVGQYVWIKSAQGNNRLVRLMLWEPIPAPRPVANLSPRRGSPNTTVLVDFDAPRDLPAGTTFVGRRRIGQAAWASSRTSFSGSTMTMTGLKQGDTYDIEIATIRYGIQSPWVATQWTV